MINTNHSSDDSYQPPLRPNFARHHNLMRPFSWLQKGVKDSFTDPLTSLIYGFVIFIISLVVIVGLSYLRLDYILLPALSSFMVVGPVIASGLYQTSRALSRHQKPTLKDMILTRTQSPGQILFVGVILMLVMMLWLRAAFLLYALFFGMTPFTGFDQMIAAIFTTHIGWGLLAVGSFVGGLFAAFSFAISAFSIPMLLNEKKDAFSAMGISMAMSWANKRVSMVWGLIVMTAFAFCVVTGFIGMIIVFPILGHATWHAYMDMRGEAAQKDLSMQS